LRVHSGPEKAQTTKYALTKREAADCAQRRSSSAIRETLMGGRLGPSRSASRPAQISDRDLVEIGCALFGAHGAEAWQYGDAMGLPHLREAIAAYVRTSVVFAAETETDHDRERAQQALDLATASCSTPSGSLGRRAWYWLVHRALQSAGCRAVPSARGSDGSWSPPASNYIERLEQRFVAPSISIHWE